jgi:ATP-dependent helicase/nuclease subunit B
MKLTPNRRLANYLRKMDPHLTIFPITEWLEKCYDTHALAHPGLSPYRLKAEEEVVVWEKIVATSQIGESLLNPRGTALLARDAWALSVRWRVPLGTALEQTEDSLTYQGFADSYRNDCQKMHRVDTVTFIDEIILLIQTKKIIIPVSIECVGFEELTPQLQELFNLLKEQGVKISYTSLVSKPGMSCRIAAKDGDEEFRLAALQAKRWIEMSPQGLIGIVVPELEKNRAMVVRLLAEILPLDWVNIAAPLPLLDYPMFDDMLLILSLMQGKHAFEKWSRFLRSPFLTHALSEQNSRAMLDVLCRKQRIDTFSMNTLTRLIKKFLEKNPSIQSSMLLNILEKLGIYQQEIKAKHCVSEWAVILQDVLKAIGWPGEQPLSEDEKNIFQQATRLFNTYAEMGSVLGEQTAGEALTSLYRLAGSLTFLPPVPSAKIHVLGLLEAVGLPFQFLWVTGLHQEAWPLDPAPNPFIPLSIQRRQGLPRSFAARELKIAKQLTERLCQGGKEVIFSYPLRLENNRGDISSLLKHLPERSVADLNLAVQTPFSSATAQSLAPYDWKEAGSPFQQNKQAVGGTKLFKLQAECPFKAFAELRLHASTLPTPVFALTEGERGEIIHDVLQEFWQAFSHLAEVQALSSVALDEHIQAAIDRVFSILETRQIEGVSLPYLFLEKQRIFRLLERFIALEKTREPFDIVGCEVAQVVNFQGLNIKVRIDRIDRLSDGTHLLIDYKTGNTTLNAWFGERPRDPQLPFYGVTHPRDVSGISYGVCRSDEIKLKGVSEEKEAFLGSKRLADLSRIGAENDWKTQCATWTEMLSRLAAHFQAGIAEVDPIEGEKTCRRCHLQSLCRIGSRRP